MTHPSKRKGSNGEREFIKEWGGGKKIPLSGALGGEWIGDVEIPELGRGEIKRRKDGFKQLYAWLEGKDFLAVRADRREWLVVMRMERLRELLKKGETE